MSAPEGYHIGQARRFRGRWKASGDKSMTHRAFILGALAEGETCVMNANPGRDCESTRRCLEALGVVFEAEGKGQWRVTGKSGRFTAAESDLDAGNSGTTARLLAGLLAAQPFESRIDGDDSLRKRPMERVAEPLRALGAEGDLAEGGHLPMCLRGAQLKACDWDSPLASAQVKSAFLLAALQAEGLSRYREPLPSRDHSERMLEAMGVKLERDEEGWILIEGSQLPRARRLEIPGDVSSAAYLLGAAILVEGGSIVVKGVGINPTRAGMIGVLERMGAKLAIYHPRESAGEPLADLLAQHGQLRGVEVHEDEIPSLLDEIPLLAALASQAKGASVFRGLGELRHKESDRLSGSVRMLEAFGAEAGLMGDDLHVEGSSRLRACEFDAAGDHRMAMAASVLALAASGKSLITGVDAVASSFPEFPSLLRRFSSKALAYEKGAGK